MCSSSVRVQEGYGSLMLDDHETQLYDAVEEFAAALWSDACLLHR